MFFSVFVSLLRQNMSHTLVPRLILYLVFIYFFVRWNCDVTRSTGLYCSVWALICHQLICEVWVSVLWFCDRQWEFLQLEQLRLASVLGSVLYFAVAYLAVGFTIARWMPEKGQYTIGHRQLVSALILWVLFEMMLTYMVGSKILYEDAMGMALLLLVQGYCATILYLQNELFKKSLMRQELHTLNLLRQQQAEQYRLSKENIALINRKCHDLKHQIRALRDMADENEREHYLSEVENSIRIYEAIVKTGNEVLDTILTEKSLHCKEREISIHCVADGEQLSFMDSIDLYTIFGNAIDNAIESVQHFSEREKRQIDVLIYRQQQFLVVNIINPVWKKPQFKDNLPVTTKKDKGYHGYGLKSIRHTVKKYDGFLSIEVENGCFSLKMLFPASSPLLS
jgi:hypothetical protein